MQKRVNQLIVLSSLILLLGLSFASAGFFGDVWNSITGNVVKESNLVAYYTFNEDVVDEQVNGDLCTLYNIDASNFIGGFKNGAMKLNGIDEYLTCPGYNLKDFTISMWVKLDEKAWHAIVERGTNGRYGLWYSGSENRIYLASGASASKYKYSSVTDIEDGEWHYLVGVYRKNSGAIFFVDGISIGSVGGIVEDSVTSGDLVIGQSSRYGTSYTKGLIDELKIWNTALIASEVKQEYDSYFEEPEPKCTDSDGGIDYNVKGTVMINGDLGGTDYCGAQNDANMLVEYSCFADGVAVDNYNCPNGCEDGACLSEPEPTCEDSDGGLNYEVQGTTKGLNAFNETITATDYCVYAGVEGTYGMYLEDGQEAVMEYVCNGKSINDDLHICTNGCQDGACLSEPEPNITCTDSDGGKDYYVKGIVFGDLSPFGNGYDGVIGEVYDFCVQLNEEGAYPWVNEPLGDNTWNRHEVQSCKEDCAIYEMSCENGIIWTTVPHCPNGCQDGACLPEPEKSCSSIFENPVLFENIGRFTLSGGWTRIRNLSYYGGFGSSGKYREINYRSSEIGKRIEVIILKLDNENINIQNSEWLQEVKSDSFWTKKSYGWSKGELQEIYTLVSNRGNEKVNFWFKDNYFIFISEQSNNPYNNTDQILEFVEKLKDNDFEWIGSEYSSTWELNEITRKYLESCESNIQEPCRPSWQKKVEPVVCPPHGTQNEIIIDLYGCGDKKEREVQCSPGMCAGCYKPRWAWLDWKSEDNICVPYGTRFMEEKEDEDKVYEGMEGNEEEGYELQIIDANNIKFRIWNLDENMDSTYNLQEGESFSINLGGGEFKLLLKDIIYSSKVGVENYVILSVFQDFPVYCNYDGQIKKQTADWQSCQNSYECESNLCSGGECTGINQMIQSVAGYKSFVVKIICKLGNFFGLRDYEECVVNRLGEEYLESQTSGRGGSSNSSGGGDSGGSNESSSLSSSSNSS